MERGGVAVAVGAEVEGQLVEAVLDLLQRVVALVRRLTLRTTLRVRERPRAEVSAHARVLLLQVHDGPHAAADVIHDAELSAAVVREVDAALD